MSEPVEVAVVLISRKRQKEKEYLIVWNPKWEGFSFPMTKRRNWKGADGEPVAENWLDAAGRAAFECLGRTSTPRPALENHVEVEHSGRDGAFRVYHYHVLEVEFAANQAVTAQAAYEWHTADEIKNLHPVTSTARHIAGMTFIP
jgi:hypothetical protein